MSRCAWSNDKELILVPYKSHHPCAVPGCPNLTVEKYCDVHKGTDEHRRGSSSARGYDYRWRMASKAFLRAHPLCAECERQGKLTPATEVDHIQPHRGNKQLFWDERNWQGLCHNCHSKKTATEDGGFGNTTEWL